ncbi:hypothetical protein ASPVEDRAFT_457979 [Aspergillus versicolor CBS 583.65]|uniref:Uncharacterized protein n=1 Tax=Aspergillus versicolor CBS 583.65 TaxID=1036611 RepID=A0A1L9PAD3_ASPVE|nr:uncharacterized protein ASPVEDRAFT_457979 [Aspergillus versicolor CBS 583.65]OJI98422.1 hypothetical protein ASPVEDRAFT_457979 [Aspergillus versicolor CBS 583.65]
MHFSRSSGRQRQSRYPDSWRALSCQVSQSPILNEPVSCQPGGWTDDQVLGTSTRYILVLRSLMCVSPRRLQTDSKDSTITITSSRPPTGPLRHAQFSSGRTQILRLCGSSSVSMKRRQLPFRLPQGGFEVSIVRTLSRFFHFPGFQVCPLCLGISQARASALAPQANHSL